MALGPVVFDLVTNLTDTDAEAAPAFAKHEIINGPPIYEAMGEDEASFSLSGVIHPEHFGGLPSLDILERARAAQLPLPLMRGDFTPLGWVLIGSVKQQSGFLSPQGIGREIRFTVSLIRVGNPGIGLAQSILRLFL